MKTSMNILCAVAVALTLGGCSSYRSIDMASLAGKWNVISVNGQSVVPADAQSAPYLAFDVQNGRMTANGSCNQLMCDFSKDAPAGALTFGRVAGTLMACPDMTLEDNIKLALENTTGYRGLKNGEVQLLSGNTPVMTLRKGYQDYSISTLEGKWTIRELNGKELKSSVEDPLTITFDSQGQYFCTTGCNSVRGDFQTNYTAITFGKGMSTRMACPDMSVEQGLQTALPAIVSYGRTADGGLAFYDARNEMLMKLNR